MNQTNSDNIGQIKILNRDMNRNYKVVLEMSKEAMIGFGISAIRLEEGLPENYDIRIEPLGSCCANQHMGFFLTPDSPQLFIYGKEYGDLKENSINIVHDIGDKNKATNKNNIDMLVDLEWDDDYYEMYNIGFNNVARIRVYEDEEELISKRDIAFILSENAFLGLGTSLLRIAHNYKEGNSYVASSIEQNKEIGFYLTNESQILEIRCKSFENAFHYDKNII